MNDSIGLLNEVAGIVIASLGRATVYGSIAIMAALAVSLWVRRLPAYAKCWLLRLAIVKLLVAGIWLTPIELPVLPAAIEHLAVLAKSTIGSWSFERLSLPTAAGPTDIADVASGITVPFVAAVPKPTAVSMESWLLLMWIIGCSVMAGRLVRWDAPFFCTRPYER